MKLLDARVNGMPRQVTTKYGDKAVLDVATSEGNFTVWRPAGDSEVMGRRNGERVSIAITSGRLRQRCQRQSFFSRCKSIPFGGNSIAPSTKVVSSDRTT